jgi:pimeloyl-ACP methyl ester carboxylesterase
MSLIKNLRIYPSKTSATKEAFVLCGFGGSVWQTRRLISELRRNGYTVTALDFPKEVLSKGDARLLPQLINEVVALAEAEAKKLAKPILLVGISLGALIALNILRRSPLFNEGVLITGGDIVKVAQSIYGSNVWPHSYEELAKEWQHINMYTQPERLTGKRLLFVLPAKDRLIDVQDVHNEVKMQNKAGNHLILITRRSFGHIGTIIEETILFPERTLSYIEQVKG